MSDFFDDLGSFFKSVFGNNDASDSRGRRKFYDPDMQDAWDELEEYLNEGKPDYAARKKNGYTSSGSSQSSQSSQSHQKARYSGQQDNQLKQDYANLKVPYGSSMAVVKEAYKKLLRQYHPDRHANNPEKLKMATEITARINNSYQRIEEYEKKKGKG